MGLIIRGVHSSSRRHTRSDIACDQIADTPILSTDLNDWDLHPVTPFSRLFGKSSEGDVLTALT